MYNHRSQQHEWNAIITVEEKKHKPWAHQMIRNKKWKAEKEEVWAKNKADYIECGHIDFWYFNLYLAGDLCFFFIVYFATLASYVSRWNEMGIGQLKASCQHYLSM